MTNNCQILLSIPICATTFWDAPDSLQDLYDAICDYLEVDSRLETLNARFEAGAYTCPLFSASPALFVDHRRPLFGLT
jgi:hypothetical protein